MAIKPNLNFELGVRDIEIIEDALRSQAGSRGLAIVQGETSEKLKSEMIEINNLMGKIYHQKNWYRPKGKFVSG